MRRVVAALDTVAEADPILDTAVRIGEIAGADVEAVHIRSTRQESVSALNLCAARRITPLHVLDGPVEATLFRALNAADVQAAVLGTRSSQGAPHLGHIAAGILRHLNKSMVFVPHGVVLSGDIRRLVVPLEGTEISSRPVRSLLKRIESKNIELVVVHVFTEETLPKMLDRPYRDLEMIGQQFIARHCPPATDIRLRQGPVAAAVNEVTAEGGDCDLVVLSWSQDLSAGRAKVIREVLGSSVAPVLVLPVELSPEPDQVCQQRAVT
jgi:hypothetical protein